ncbi:helix-turn-helix transcriptional regulator [Actinomadura pelletieri]|nr:LuxR family transcriptional regulator [Actinomadura pelletieri]
MGSTFAIEYVCSLASCDSQGRFVKLVERAGEMDVLRNLLDACAQGRGGIAMIDGPPMIGKSALLHAFADTAAARDAVFLQATCSQAEQELPLGVMAQLLENVSLPAGDGERTARLLESAALIVPHHERRAGLAGGVTAHVLRGLGNVLLDLAERGPVVIGVDDVQYADAQSMECLLYLVRRVRSTRIVIVLTGYASRRQESLRFRGELLRQPWCCHLRLGVLSLGGVTTMLTDAVGARYAEELAPGCYAMTGGNPALVRAFAEALRESEPGRAPGPISAHSLSHAAAALMFRCEPMIYEVAGAAAVLGEHARVDLLGKLLDAPSEAITHALDILDSAGLVNSVRFRHDTVRAAVLTNIPSGARATLHRRAAQVLYDDGAVATVVAEQLLAGGTDGIPWMVPVLRTAAELALADDDLTLATSCLQAARKACTDERELLETETLLVKVVWRVSPSAGVRYLPRLTEAARKGQLKHLDAVALIEYLLWFGSFQEAVEILEVIEKNAASTVEGAAKMERDIALIRFRLSCFCPDYAPRPPEPAVAPPNHPIRLSELLTETREGDLHLAVERILQRNRLDDGTLIPIVGAVTALLLADRVDAAAHWCDVQLAEATARRAPMWRAMFESIRARIDVRRGRLAAAERSAHAALSLMPPENWGVMILMPIATMVLVATARGKLEDAAGYLSTPVPEPAFDTVGWLHYLQARGRYYLAIGSPDAALDDFRNCGELVRKWDRDPPALLPWRIDAARAYLALGANRRAEDLLRAQLELLGPEPTVARGVALRVLATNAEPRRRAETLREAVDVLQAAGDRFELALATAELGRSHHALGEVEQARTLIATAHRLAEEAGVELSSDVLSPKQGGTPPDATPEEEETEPGPLTLLSDAELRVASLAAQGHTNREIASRLYITVSTVEQHLTQVYRKLRVTRRKDLPLELDPSVAKVTSRSKRRTNRLPLSRHHPASIKR